MASVILVFDRFGVKVGEFTQNVRREWLLNEPGEAQFSVSAVAELTRVGPRLASMLQFGNLVHIPGMDGLPDWTGVIERRDWQGGIVTVTARGAEQVLAFASPDAISKQTGPAGGMFAKILELVNRQVDTKIRPGSVFSGGTRREETLEGVDLLTEAQRIAERSGHDFDVTGVVSAAGLGLVGNWYERKGIDSGLVLSEGGNLAAPGGNLLTEDAAELANRVIGWPDAATGSSRKPVIVTDDESARVYGARWAGESYTNVTEDDTLLKHCQTVIRRRGKPTRLVGGAVLKDFDRVWIGNQVRVVLYSAGMRDDGSLGCELSMRVVGARFDDDAPDRMELALEEN